MGPTRTKQSDPSSSKQNTKKKPYQKEQQKDRLPGVQKLKSSLRQTRRLLAKDNLAADVRLATERRQKALEQDLAKAETASQERTNATRYHRVKFFERKKAVRKITQMKKSLASGKLSKSKQKEAEDGLREARIDLNYINHFPKSKKYISLYPPEKRHTNEDGDGNTHHQQDPTTFKSIESRDEVRAWIRECMEKGELSQEPELQMQSGHSRLTSSKSTTMPSKGWSKVQVPLSTAKGGNATSAVDDPDGVENDDFFEVDPEDETDEDDTDSDSDSE